MIAQIILLLWWVFYIGMWVRLLVRDRSDMHPIVFTTSILVIVYSFTLVYGYAHSLVDFQPGGKPLIFWVTDYTSALASFAIFLLLQRYKRFYDMFHTNYWTFKDQNIYENQVTEDSNEDCLP